LSLLVRGEGPKSLTPEGVSYMNFRYMKAE
jgi:hypothetical protein